MVKIKAIVAMAGLSAVAILGVACGSGTAPAAASPEPAPSTIQPVVSAPAVEPVAPSIPAIIPIGAPALPALAPAREFGAPIASRVPAYSGATLYQANNGQAGIWVNGQSTFSAEPDLAMLNIGVETNGRTVAEANGEAAEAMDAIIKAVRARGLAEEDIQTTSFNIWPQYEYNEVFENGRRVGKQELVGFRVSNSATIKVRDLDAIGEIIDEVANAGGDATRINGINFTVEDPKPFMAGLREAAVKDAIAKAEQFADLANVSVGRLVFITETSGGAPVVVKDFARGMIAEAAAAPAFSTSISPGELEFRMSVQVVFEIL